MRAETAHLELPLVADQRAAFLGRRAIDAHFGSLPVCDEAKLVVTELVTNAVRHGASPIVLRVELFSLALHVEVEDSNPDMGPDRADSRGLAMIRAVTARSGVTFGMGSKTVWATLPTHS